MRNTPLDEAMKFSLITPAFNASEFIADTVSSVLDQKGDFSVEYILVDGASTDNTVAIARELLESSAPEKFEFTIISEPDLGMYDALVKGLRLVQGDFVGYINASDFLHRNALAGIAEILREHPEVMWLSGRRSWCNPAGVVAPTSLPYKYESKLVRGFFYGAVVDHIPQESTLWHRDLIDVIDLGRLARFRYAGDFFLWCELSRHARLHVANVCIGCFRQHAGQLSTANEYIEEVESIKTSNAMPWPKTWIHRLIWRSPEYIRRMLGHPLETAKSNMHELRYPVT